MVEETGLPPSQVFSEVPPTSAHIISGLDPHILISGLIPPKTHLNKNYGLISCTRLQPGILHVLKNVPTALKVL